MDISQLRGQRGLQLASIILAEVFTHNQHEFTKAKPRLVPSIAVVEEAQTVLSGGTSAPASAEDGPFVSWVKEGRKYGLSAVLITQQPGKRAEFAQRLYSKQGLAWGKVQAWLAQAAPPEEVVGDRFQWARAVVRPALIAIIGPEGSGWRTQTRPHPERPGASQTWIFLTETVEEVEHATPPEEQA